MAGQCECKNCGFVGYPEVARKENFWKMLFLFFFDTPNARKKPMYAAMRPSDEKIENWVSSKSLRCPRCKQTDTMSPVDSAEKGNF